MYTLLSGTRLRLQAGQTKAFGLHTKEQFQMGCHIVAWRQRRRYKSLFVNSKEISQKRPLYSSWSSM